MIEGESKQIIGVNTVLLRGAQVMTTVIILALQWSALASALFSSAALGGAELLSQLLILLILFGVAISLTTVGVIYLHGKLINVSWGKNPNVNRFALFREILAIFIACGLCWSLWPKLAKSAYLARHDMLAQLISFVISISLAVVVVMVFFGGGYSLFLFKKTHRREADNS